MDVKKLKIWEFLNVVLDNNDEVTKMAIDFSKNILNGRIILTGKGTGRTITLRKCETITANTKKISVFMDFLNSNFISLCINKSDEYKRYILETLIGINLLKYIRKYYVKKLCDEFLMPFYLFLKKNNNSKVTISEMIKILKEFNKLTKLNSGYNLFNFISAFSIDDNDSFDRFISNNYPYLDLLDFDIECIENKEKLESILIKNYRPIKKNQLIEPILRFMRENIGLDSISLMIDNFDLIADNDPIIQHLITEYFELFDNVVITTDSDIDYNNEIFRFEKKGYELVQFGYGRNAEFLKKIIDNVLCKKYFKIIPILNLDNDKILDLSLMFDENIEYLIRFFCEVNMLYLEMLYMEMIFKKNINECYMDDDFEHKFSEIFFKAISNCIESSNELNYENSTLNLENKHINEFYNNVLRVYKELINEMKNQKKPILYI